VKVRVDGLACAFCAYGLEKKLKRVEGVTNLEIDLDRGLAILHFEADARVDEDVLAEKVREAGFTRRRITVEEPGAERDAGAEGAEAVAEPAVTRMPCERCSATIEAALRRVHGVTSVGVDLGAEATTVVYDPARTGPRKLIQAIEDSGVFRASVRDEPPPSGNAGNGPR